MRAPGLLADRSSSTASSAASSTTRRSRRIISRDQALATRTVRGGSVFGIYPLNRYRRVEFSAGLVNFNEAVQRPGAAGSTRSSTSSSVYGQPVFRNGTMLPLQRGVRPGDDGLPRVRAAGRQHDAAGLRRGAEDRQPAVAADRSTATLRYYQRLGGTGRAGAARTRLQELRRLPDFIYFGGNSEMRGYDYLQFVGQNVVLRQRRAALPAHRGGADADRRARRRPRRVLRRHRRRVVQRPALPVLDEQATDLHADRRLQRRSQIPVSRPRPSSATRCRSPGSASWTAARSYGFGLETFALGFPDPLRLGLAHALQQGLGGRGLRGSRRQHTNSAARSSRCGSGTTSKKLRMKNERMKNGTSPVGSAASHSQFFILHSSFFILHFSILPVEIIQIRGHGGAIVLAGD